jgi:pimeloyl-ACP methyl ester carboxylesterase
MPDLAYDRQGSGPPLLLIHGIGSRRGVWDPVVGLLAREREVIALDLPGFGDSPPLPDGVEPTVGALADAVEAFAREHGLGGVDDAQPAAGAAAEPGAARWHVAGNSLGGGIALELARRGAVASATALSPIGFWSEPERRYSVALLRISRRAARHAGGLLSRAVGWPGGRTLLLGTFYGHPLRRELAAARADLDALGGCQGFEATLARFRGHRFQDGERLASVAVTIGWGTRDRLLIPKQAQRARAALPAARHVPLAGCGHVPMSDDPEGVAALLLAASA